jgi:hypothetical protein
MTAVALAGAKGALGVTALCMGLARSWREHERVLVVEADPDGGVLAARLGLSQEPGLGTLAAAGRHEVSEQLVACHTQEADGMKVLVAPSSPSHVRAALRSVSAKLGQATSIWPDAMTFVDVGRLDGQSTALPLAESAEIVLLLTTPNLEGADALAVRLVELEDLRSRCRLVTVGDGPYESAELSRVLSIPHVAHLPIDPASAAAIWTARATQRGRRRPLIRAIAALVGVLRDLESCAPSGHIEPAQDSAELPLHEQVAP